MTECYECSRLAELVAENGALRDKCEKQAEVLDMQQELLDEFEYERSNDDSAPENVVTADEADANDENEPQPYIVVDGERKWVESDSREKLESDIIEHYTHTTSTLMWPDSANIKTRWISVSLEMVIGWLDRQAAITKRELCGHCRMLDECVAGKCRTLAALQAKVDELERENALLSDREFYLRCTLVDKEGNVL